MPFSLMNGLSAMGAGVAQFAGTAGLEAQRAELARQQLTLADSLATTRESKGRREAGEIAATAAGKEHEFQGEQGAMNRTATAANLAVTEAGATTRLGLSEAGANTRLGLSEAGANTRAATAEAGANTRNAAALALQYSQLAAGDETRAQDVLASRQKTAFEKVQTDNAKALNAAHDALQAEIAKSDADPEKIASITSQIVARETSATTEAATTTARALMYRTDQDAVTQLNTRIQAATAALNSPDMSDPEKKAQKAEIANLQIQLKGAQRALQDSSALAHAAVLGPGAAPAPSGGTRPPLSSFGGASPPLPNPRAGPRVSPAPEWSIINNMVSP